MPANFFRDNYKVALQSSRVLRMKLIPRSFLSYLSVIGSVLYVLIPLRNQWNLNAYASNFWFDESGQFLISQGLNHFSSLTQPTGSLIEVLNQNQDFNLDPGGFSIFLRLWTVVFGSSPTALRACVFAATVCLVVGAILIVWLVTKSVLAVVLFSWLLPRLAYSDPHVFHYSIELRAYSYSLAASVLLPLLGVFLIRFHKTLLWIFVLCMCCLTASLRYEGVICALAVTISWLIVASADKEHFRKCLVASLLLVAFIASIYLWMARIQNGGEPPSYVANYMVDSFDLIEATKHLIHNLGSWPYSLRLPSILIGGLTLFATRKRTGALKRQLFFLVLFQSFVLTAQLFLSVLGRMPWWVGLRWSLNDIGYSVVAAITLIIALCVLTQHIKYYNFSRAGIVLISSALLIFSDITEPIRADQNYSRSFPNLVESGGDFWTTSNEPLLFDYGMMPDFHYLVRFSGQYPEILRQVTEIDIHVWFPYQTNFPFLMNGENVCNETYRFVLESAWDPAITGQNLSDIEKYGVISGRIDVARNSVHPGWNLFRFTPFENCLALTQKGEN